MGGKVYHLKAAPEAAPVSATAPDKRLVSRTELTSLWRIDAQHGATYGQIRAILGGNGDANWMIGRIREALENHGKAVDKLEPEKNPLVKEGRLQMSLLEEQ